MSGSALPSPQPPRKQDVLGELLHSLSQPLTSLRCSLELSIDHVAASEQEAVCAALEQTERAMHVVQLMQEYLETERPRPAPQAVLLAPVLQDVLDQFFEIAEVRQIRLRLVGGGDATIRVADHHLRLALQYLIGAVLEEQPPRSNVVFCLEGSPSQFVLLVRTIPGALGSGFVDLAPTRDPISETLRNGRLAIASRVLESAGASVEFGQVENSGFIVRMPQPPKLASAFPA